MPETILSQAAINSIQEFPACRSCGESLDSVLDLGIHAVSDFLDSNNINNETWAPLRLAVCRFCGLVQLSHSVSKEYLYRNYWYHSGGNEAMVAALRDVVEDARRWVDLNHGDAVLDIGCNDGTLLDCFPREIERLGFEPSNLSWEAQAKGHRVTRRYYPLGGNGPSWPAKLKAIFAIAMFYDVDDPDAFVAQIKSDLHPDGVWVVQMMDLDAMLAANAFDNICHEHVVYWSATDFRALCARHCLEVAGISRNKVNGGSIRFIVKHSDEPVNNDGRPTREKRHRQLIEFSDRIENSRKELLAFLEQCYQEGKTVLGYGASTKGNTLLQYYGIDRRLLPAIAERNPAKWGKVTSGSHIPIISEEEMRARRPCYLLILPWAFLDNFLEREKDLRLGGTRFIVPLPTLRVI